ncbi:hypothetical protein EYF80_046149 [Liparis tanakae]|uniref:Uncharacterized protein n=1 Tax=Liparis tanakae TaxID=230148 RepID=A0A4Z2FR62_9TELE|nr:hypothetical protein EYF80_046149 [Liparis tanakae]
MKNEEKKKVKEKKNEKKKKQEEEWRCLCFLALKVCLRSSGVTSHSDRRVWDASEEEVDGKRGSSGRFAVSTSVLQIESSSNHAAGYELRQTGREKSAMYRKRDCAFTIKARIGYIIAHLR